MYIFVCAYMCVCACMLSLVWLFVTPWTVACQAPLSKGFSRQEYWSALPFPRLPECVKPDWCLTGLSSAIAEAASLLAVQCPLFQGNGRQNGTSVGCPLTQQRSTQDGGQRTLHRTENQAPWKSQSVSWGKHCPSLFDWAWGLIA